MWPIRSALFVPAHRRDWVAKAIRVSPGAVVLDIEDSVPPQFKPEAMAHLKSEIHELRAAGVGAFVRIQPLFEVRRPNSKQRSPRVLQRLCRRRSPRRTKFDGCTIC